MFRMAPAREIAIPARIHGSSSLGGQRSREMSNALEGSVEALRVAGWLVIGGFVPECGGEVA